MTALWADALALAFAAGGLLGYAAGKRNRRIDAWLDARTHRAEEKLAGRETATRRQQPDPGPDPDIPVDFWPSLYGPARVRSAVTAADIAPVIVPEPKLTDTGELRRIKEKGEAIRAALIGGES